MSLLKGQTDIGGGEVLVELGTFDFNDINNAPATATIQIALSTPVPTGFYIEKIGLTIAGFVSITDVIAVDNLGDDGNLLWNALDLSAYGVQLNTTDVLIPAVGLASGAQIKSTADAQTNLQLSFQGSGSNQQNFTQGSATIYVIIKQFPF